jgi:hypothetical protein
MEPKVEDQQAEKAARGRSRRPVQSPLTTSCRSLAALNKGRFEKKLGKIARAKPTQQER